MTWMDRLTGANVLPLVCVSLKGAVLAAPLFFAGAGSAMPQSPQFPDHLEATAYSDLTGWRRDDHLAALNSFLRFCSRNEDPRDPTPSMHYGLDEICSLCLTANRESINSETEARRFLETNFRPYRVTVPGFVTGYFEPEVAASRKKTDGFDVPLHRKPAGLEAITPENKPDDWSSHLSHGRRTNSRFEELPDRSAIMDGALDGEGLELAWLADPIDAYFIHVQGSARLRMIDGSVMRVGYAGKTGHPYTGIGRLLVKRGEGTPEDFTMAGLRSWLAKNPAERDALFRENQSYIFFREVTDTLPGEGPIGAAGLPLVPGRSLAIDPDHIPYGAFVFLQADFPDLDAEDRSFSRLMVADDTGSAIKGKARGDIFVGSGNLSGDIAGRIRHAAQFTVLLPVPGCQETEAATD
ncbi:MltA domain-containing protein [Labrenzia sp. DG1229]|uniref:murein transglycosylase A n=1 Tax=Labrenzia sp. DG1229 TaxID=681847 RepID=UPI001AD8AAE0|nr:MltA domain-containing protein [Labrenzia sp. DG1229]